MSGLPAAARDRWPLLVNDADEILWVCGLRIDERARVMPSSRQIALDSPSTTRLVTLHIDMQKQLKSAHLQNPERFTYVGLAALLLVVAVTVVAGWRYFPGFTGDQSWFFQVARRVSLGDTLYSDVAWAYGPAPIYALAALFRWFGPDAGWASLINGTLTIAAVALTYGTIRRLIRPEIALLVTAFATFVGPYVWGGLFRIHYYVYSPAVTWGSVASLLSLYAAARWVTTHKSRWVIVAGIAAGGAILSKPEFGITAIGSCMVALFLGRASRQQWGIFAICCIGFAGVSFAAQAGLSGWKPLLRGYTGYDQLANDSDWLWGTRIGDKRRFFAGYAIWIMIAALFVGHIRPRWRRPLLALASIAGLVILYVSMSYLAGGFRTALEAVPALLQGNRVDFYPFSLFETASWPWVPVVPALVLFAWLARTWSAPAIWWVLWAFAGLSNVRFVLTGLISGYSVAPVLALLWWLLHSAPHTSPNLKRSLSGAFLAGLAIVSVTNLVGQIVVPNPQANEARTWISTVLGPIRVNQSSHEELASVARYLDANLAPDAHIFSLNYGAQWYLLSGRSNPTAFDVFITGLGPSGAEAAITEQELLENPPEAVLVPANWSLDPQTDAAAVAAKQGELAVREHLPVWWKELSRDYTDHTPPAATYWRLLLRTAKS